MLLWAGAVMAQAPAASAEPSPFFVEAAECSAAYKAEVTARLAQPKTESRDQAILADTENSFIFIGVAYKQGLRKAEADELLRVDQLLLLGVVGGDRARSLGDDVGIHHLVHEHLHVHLRVPHALRGWKELLKLGLGL